MHEHLILPQPRCQLRLGMQHCAVRTRIPVGMNLFLFF